MARSRAAVAGGVDWKVAVIFLVIGVLCRDQIVAFSVWAVGGSATPVAAQQIVQVAPRAEPPIARPPQVFTAPPAARPPPLGAWTIPAAPVEPAPAVEPAVASPQSLPMPVVITPTLEYSRNVAVARRERSGHFTFATEVNGVEMPMFFDTGASYVTLRSADAARVGIDVGSLAYSITGRTANGTAEFALVTISTLTVGTITRRNVAALVARPGRLDVNLLGQSFLTRVASVNVDGNQLVIRGGEMREDR